MPSCGPCVLSSVLAAIAASGLAVAQDRTAERDLVEAFSAYCVATAAEPARVKIAVEKIGTLAIIGVTAGQIGDHWGEVEEYWIVGTPGQEHPHHKMLVAIGYGLGESGRKRTCLINTAGGDKAKLLAEVGANLTTVDGVSDMIKERNFEIDVTRWTIRVGDADALVELGAMPTFAGAPRLGLRLTAEGQ